jgi:hypothetical protein
MLAIDEWSIPAMEPVPWLIPCIFVVAVPADDVAEDVGADVAAPRAAADVAEEP